MYNLNCGKYTRDAIVMMYRFLHSMAVTSRHGGSASVSFWYLYDGSRQLQVRALFLTQSYVRFASWTLFTGIRDFNHLLLDRV